MTLREIVRQSLERVVRDPVAAGVEVDSLMGKFRLCLEQYESKRIRALQADLEIAQHENSLLAELNENLRRWLIANTAASVGAARALGMVDGDGNSQNNQSWESLKVVPNTPPPGHKLQMPGRL